MVIWYTKWYNVYYKRKHPMATHSTAYVPTNRKPGEYIMSEGWSDGMLDSVGLGWYLSTPRIDESIRAVMLIDGSPVFADTKGKGFELKEGDYIEEGVRDMMPDADEDFLASVAETLEAIERGDFAAAETTAYARMSFEDKKDNEITNNNAIHTIADFADLPEEYGQTNVPARYDQAALVEALKQYDPNRKNVPGPRPYTPDVWCWYYYHDGLKQWWGIVILPDESTMYIPLIVAFYIEGNSPLADARAAHVAHPNAYVADIAVLAAFEAAMDAALTR